MARGQDMKPCSPPSLRTCSTPGPQIKMVGVAEQNLDAEFFQDVLRNALDRCQRADRHEDGSLDLAVRSQQAARAGGAGGGVNFELERHAAIVAIRNELSAVSYQCSALDFPATRKHLAFSSQ